ncbi:unnamed protein product [Rotaria socialis]|uniref:Uncharacterized protein n=1 Tax=Rotaria socialis TaxID=392032 RepID=A0A821UB10_9BILA|nr:unnamed protein product [Rotaria socialis]
MQIIHLSYEINLLKIHYSSFYQQSGSRYKHDHNYWLNYDFVMKTPKRRRLSSAYSKTLLPPTTSIPRQTTRFRKSYGKTKPPD